jgi:hypothetical protein
MICSAGDAMCSIAWNAIKAYNVTGYLLELEIS